ncbi:hypothetical protein [Aquimarina latercula]|uniref:hypothetical protein n=1 Tax=Aquimarina latercula TaxID=987 RepID=UPI000481FFD0|nr:hypothetical protein [Aquimarina latercula]
MLVKKDRIDRSDHKTILKTPKMTSAYLRSFQGFESITDDEAEKTILILEQFCEIVLKHTLSSQNQEQQ